MKGYIFNNRHEADLDSSPDYLTTKNEIDVILYALFLIKQAKRNTMTEKSKHSLLKLVPGVDRMMELAKHDARFTDIPSAIVKTSIRHILEKMRKSILTNGATGISDTSILSKVLEHACSVTAPRLISVVNATGVVLHTNLGRSLLCEDALNNMKSIAAGYSNLEFNIEKGKRGIRYSAIEDILCELTGASAAMAVNNNAGAVLLCLDTMAKGKEVIVSRGELVEIGGSFRIPDVMKKSGAVLKEVGTTNRTHLRDYQTKISENTGLLLKVHTSNYKIQGFTSSVSLKELVDLGKKTDIPVMQDLGSGTLIDLSKYGLGREPTVSQSLKSGADIVTFSGDKLLGGPQAGIIAGNRSAIEKIKENPLTRALRIDKLTLAALESTLRLYRDEATAVKKIPTLRMLTLPFEDIALKADKMLKIFKKAVNDKAVISLMDLSSMSGGGAFPDLSLPTRCILIKPVNMSAAHLERKMRMHKPSIIGRIENDRFIMDPRTIQTGEELIISRALEKNLTEK